MTLPQGTRACLLCFIVAFSGQTVNPEFFARILFSGIAIKRHICDSKNSRLGHDLHTSGNDSVISAFREDLIFTKLRICEVSRK